MKHLLFLATLFTLLSTLSFGRVIYKSSAISIYNQSFAGGGSYNENIDFNEDGDTDFSLILHHNTWFYTYPNACSSATLQDVVTDKYTYVAIVAGSKVTTLSTPIAPNVQISASSHTWHSSFVHDNGIAAWTSHIYTFVPYTPGCSNPPSTNFYTGVFGNGANGYLGVQFQISGLTHFGWIYIENSQIKGYAYETIPGFPIKTGDRTGFLGSPDPNYNTIKGNVFYDLNGNCIKDAGETGIPHIVVYTETGNYGGITDQDGNYEILVNGGTNAYNLIADTVADLNYSFSCPGQTVNASFTGNNQIVSGKNFALVQIGCSQLKVNVSSNRRRRCFRNITTVTYQNSGAISSAPAALKVIMPPYVKPLSSFPAWTSQNGDTLFYNLGVLPVSSRGTITITDSVACLAGITGITQCTKAILEPKNHCVLHPLWDASEVSLSGSCFNGTYQATLKNSGVGNMQDSLSYRIFLNDTLVKTGRFKLASQLATQVTVPANGATVRIEADQNPYHPDLQSAYLIFEGCGDPVADVIARGFVTSMPFNPNGRAESTSCLTIIDSYDPNDKKVLPEGVGTENVVLQNTDLTYTINFQNTGTDTAYTVVLADTLDANLDLTTLKILSASHAYKLEVTGKENPRLVWIFPAINLVDATTNEPKSHGFVTYTISQKEDVPPGTDIKNKAHIFFDYNEAIITNETSNRIGTYPSDLSKGNNILVTHQVTAISPSLMIDDLNIFPNPAESFLTVKTSRTDLSFELSNSIGTVLKSGPVDKSGRIDLTDLQQGIYHLKLIEGDKFLIRKIVKK